MQHIQPCSSVRLVLPLHHTRSVQLHLCRVHVRIVSEVVSPSVRAKWSTPQTKLSTPSVATIEASCNIWGREPHRTLVRQCS